MLIQAINCIVTSPSVWNFKILETSINRPVVIYRKMKVNKFMIWKNGLIKWPANLLTSGNFTHLHDKNDKTHLIHRPIDICATAPPTPDKEAIKTQVAYARAGTLEVTISDKVTRGRARFAYITLNNNKKVDQKVDNIT